MLMQRTTRPGVARRRVRALVGATQLGIGLNSPQLELVATVIIIFGPPGAFHGADMILAPGVEVRTTDFEDGKIEETRGKRSVENPTLIAAVRIIV